MMSRILTKVHNALKKHITLIGQCIVILSVLLLQEKHIPSIVLYIAILFGLYLTSKVNKYNDIPKLEEPLTRYENGYVEIKESDIDSAILYLYEVEKWIYNQK